MTIYRIGDVEAMPARHSIRRDGKLTYIRPKTFDLLLYLIGHRNRIVTKLELGAEVWKSAAITDNSVAQCINELRRALGDDSRNPVLIRTCPKLGYQFIGPVEEVLEDTRSSSRRMTSLWWVAAIVLILTAVLLGLRSYDRRSASARQGEVAWWTLDEPIGSVGAVSRVPGKLGSAVHFERDGAYLRGSDAAHLPLGASLRTITAWVKAIPSGDEMAIFHYGTRDGPAGTAFAVWLQQNGTLAAGNRIRGDGVVGTIPVLDDRWHFVAASFDGPATNSIRLFVDGRSDGVGALRNSPATGASGGWSIGRFIESGTTLRGAVDDVRVYARALQEMQIQSLYRCMSRLEDVQLGGRPAWFMPIWPDRSLAVIENTTIRSPGSDLCGVQFASFGDCSLASLHGADAGQDLEIRSELMCPRDEHGHITQAGPYFRSRSAKPGDGLLGGTSAGYWVMLHSTGEVKIRRLNPVAVVAFSPPKARFDDNVFHQLAVSVRRAEVRVWLDDALVVFDQDGRMTAAVTISAAWEGPPRLGSNEGAAGISFACWGHSDCKGTQAARNVCIVPASDLDRRLHTAPETSRRELPCLSSSIGRHAETALQPVN